MSPNIPLALSVTPPTSNLDVASSERLSLTIQLKGNLVHPHPKSSYLLFSLLASFPSACWSVSSVWDGTSDRAVHRCTPGAWPVLVDKWRARRVQREMSWNEGGAENRHLRLNAIPLPGKYPRQLEKNFKKQTSTKIIIVALSRHYKNGHNSDVH